MGRAKFSASDALVRTLCAVIGGYGLVSALAAFLARGLPAAFELPPGEAVVGASVLSFLVYLVVIVRVFALPRARRAVAEVVAVTSVLALGVLLLPRPALT